ncbi:MAG: 3'-5' exonuclease, partial [Legionellaceae bacterium]
WCGLSLEDLHCIATIDKKRSIPFAITQEELLKTLTPGGQSRVHFIKKVFEAAQKKRYQTSLVPWIIETLEALHLHAVLTPQEQRDLEQYWSLIERFECDGTLEHLTLFKDELQALYSKQLVASRLQIMTIHKAKGLEFDSVILPGLNARSALADRPLLRFMNIPTQHEGDLMLVSPIKAAHHEACPLYDFIGRLDQEKNQYEMQRLFYVAVTRAKKRLCLFDSATTPTKGTLRALLHHQHFVPIETPAVEEKPDDLLPLLYHLPMAYYLQKPCIAQTPLNLPLALPDSTARLLGVIAHEILQIICTKHVSSAKDVPWAFMKRALRSAGLGDLPALEAHLKTMIQGVFDNPRGQWIIQQHEQEKNEYALLIQSHQGSSTTRIIDRTFYDQGICWIIDFKTGHEDVLKEKEHKIQVNGYAELMRHITQGPVRCGLYYVPTHHWVEWEPVSCQREFIHV